MARCITESRVEQSNVFKLHIFTLFLAGSPFLFGLYQYYDKELWQTYHSQRHVVGHVSQSFKVEMVLLSPRC